MQTRLPNRVPVSTSVLQTIFTFRWPGFRARLAGAALGRRGPGLGRRGLGGGEDTGQDKHREHRFPPCGACRRR